MYHHFLVLPLVFCLAPAQGTRWDVMVATQDETYAGTDSWIRMEIFGTEGYMGMSALHGSFEQGDLDITTFYTDIGEPYMINLHHDGSGSYSGWKLEMILLINTETGQIYSFGCWCWLDDEYYSIAGDVVVCYGIYHCVDGYKECGGSDNSDLYFSRCNLCEAPYYSGGWYGGCIPCGTIDRCVDRYCTNSWDQQCRACQYNNVLYKPSYGGYSCADMCSYNSRYCWPGYCADGYADYCYCAEGFTVISETWETSCQLTSSPSIETCQTEAEGPNLEKKRSGSTGPTNECQYEIDFYGNFIPLKMRYDLFASFHIYKDSFPTKPNYIDSYEFGVTDVTIEVVHATVEGTEQVLNYSYPLVDKDSSLDAVPTYSHEAEITVPKSHLRNGDRLCLNYIVSGGGFLIPIDTSQAHLPRRSPTAYQKTLKMREVCYRFDDIPPQHCLESLGGMTCFTEPLKLERRISKMPEFDVEFEGWLDPVQPGGNAEHASLIESYQVTVNEVSGTNTMLKVGTEVVFTKKVDASETGMRVTVPAGAPMLFCVTLEVKDFADNLRQARRFFLYDNSTFIMARSDKDFYVSSASESSNYQWHSPNDDVCLDWKDHFYNPFYMDNNLLAQVEPDPHGLINGIYEQISGVLPVSGTPNVYGIIKYMFSYSENNSSFSPEIEVSDFLNQILCKTLDLDDGETFALKIRAVDIVNNSYSEDRVVYVDGSPPFINSIGLEKDGFRELYVHDETDLSQMNFQFDAFDPHSGIHTVEWSFGILDFDDVVESGTIAVHDINQTSCLDAGDCYCPSVGDCEIMKYSIPLHGLVAIHKHIGNHNREYYITIKVTNKALLITKETMVILVDDSPPEKGVVSEGPEGYDDIDYTRNEVFHVNWNGFLDHESGIRLYRVGLGSRCLSKEEVYQMSETVSEAIFIEVNYPENTAQFYANFTGKHYVTVIAVNNALAPSDPVCSDGISKDTTPPEFLDAKIKNARWAESLYCSESKAWFLRSDLVKVQLTDTESCTLACHFETKNSLVEAIPSQLDESAIRDSLLNGTIMLKELEGEKNTSTISHLLCSKFPMHDSKSVIYLPNDHIQLSWTVFDDFSQIQDFYVGFGESASEDMSPDLMDYLSTDKKYFFKINHAGIGTDKEFFIFLKALNKAGIETVMTIGPMLIDQTPPRYKYIPDVNINGDNIVVGWENDTFFDDEQIDEIHQISFQIEHNNKTVSPLMEWRKETASQCNEFTGGCIKYPLSILQKQDTDLALKFYVRLHVYNIAGHFLTVTTKEFTLPSMYPPAYTVVTDVDPSGGTDMSGLRDDIADIDAHFSTNTVCAIWKGFHHDEDIQLEFGIGLSKGLSDIHSLTRINYTNGHCLSSENLPTGVKIYINLRATSSAGSTTSSSDGITIYDIKTAYDDLNVFDGPECFTPRHLISKNTYASNKILKFERPLIIGRQYTLRVFSQNPPHINTNISSKIYFKKISSETETHDFVFQPYVDKPKFSISNIDDGPIKIELYDCEEDISTSVNTNTLMAHWGGVADHFTYEAAVVTLRCPEILNSTCFEYHSPFSVIKEHKWIKHELILQLRSTYYTGVRACLNSVCSSTKLSSGLTVVSVNSTIDIIEAESAVTNLDCVKISLEWAPLEHVNISFYQWSVTTKIGLTATDSILGQWRTVPKPEADQQNFRAEECVNLPIHSFKEVSVCVRAFDHTGRRTQGCKRTSDASDENVFKSTVYEFDVSVSSWDNIRKIIRSRYIGDSLKTLHQEDLDFGTEKSEVVGAVLNGHNRNITWYLTTAREIPINCDDTAECKTSKLTSDGYVTFPNNKIKYNTVYFICAYSEKSEEIQDTSKELLPSIEACSNGFVIDNIPPSAGVIHVENENGFINNLDEFAVTWSDFDDNIDVSLLGYENKINSFTLEIGSTPSRRDIKNYTDFGVTASVMVKDLMVNSGTSLFVSVIAIDHAGLRTRVSSEKLMVDIAPPTVGKITSRSTTMWISGSMLRIQLMEFADKESGIDKYITHVGSSRYKMDILQESEHTTEMIELDLHGTHVMDGHMYFLGVKAKNRAGLCSDYTFMEFGVDASPPTGGHVVDGIRMDTNKDFDFQDNLNFISGHWKGFVDVHSGIAYYTVGIGTDPLAYDVEPKINVGLRTAVIWNSTFTAGQKFFINIEACNHAGLCHALSSDGILLDDSPPISGLVKVGSNDVHHTYLPRNSSVEIFWTGFEDPQIGMQRYEACLGTSVNECDVVPTFDCLLASYYIKTGVDLPLNQNLFVTVTGYNNNNQRVSRTSNYFIVDTTPPELIIKPKVLANYSASDSIAVQTENSIIHMMWKFSDPESPIVRHIISLSTHHEGHTPIEHFEVANIERITLNLNVQNLLHNGDTYRVVVTSCNAAGLCLTAESEDLLIDSTPPHLGGLKEQMTWQNFLNSDNELLREVNLTWYGFHDYESGIKNFYIGIGSTFTGNELSKGLVQIKADMGSDVYNKLFTIDMPSNDKTVVSLVAENNAGLLSNVARVTLLTLVSSDTGGLENAYGLLEIEKHSCDIHFCNKDCTCAVIGKVCSEVQTNLTCNDIAPSLGNSFSVLIHVYGGFEAGPYYITASSSCLSAHWVVSEGLSKIKRFEWTLGIKDEVYGEGIFDLPDERPWMDVGKFQFGVYCLPLNRSLIHGTEYIVYVKAWVEMESYLIFQSLPILVDQTPPAIRKGKFVKDSDVTCTLEYDLIYWTDKISACWTDVFYETEGSIVYYIVGLGTEPGSDDIVRQRDVELMKNFDADELSLSPRQRYYFTVTAYNNVGLHTTLSSDGFVIDLDKPHGGIVYNSLRFRNYAFYSNINSFDLSWSGFFDHDSGIISYSVALFEDNENQTLVMNFIDVSLQTSVQLINLTLEHGKKYFGAVKAVDAAGHESDIIYSQSKLLDTTGPTAFKCADTNLIFNLTQNTSMSGIIVFPVTFEPNAMYTIGGSVSYTSHYPQIKLIVENKIGNNLPLGRTHDGHLQFDHSFYPSLDGTHDVALQIEPSSAVIMSVNFNQCDVVVDEDSGSALIVKQISEDTFTASINVVDLECGIKRTTFGIGTSPKGYQLEQLHPIDVNTDQLFTVSVFHKTPVYATAIVENYAGVQRIFYSEPILTDHTPPVLQNMLIETEEVTDLHVLNASDLSEDEMIIRLKVSWNARDEESGIKSCFVSIGSLSYLGDKLGYHLANSSNEMTTEEIKVSHDETIYANVKCVNNIELATIEASAPIVISVTPPIHAEARLAFIPSSMFMTTEPEVSVQPNRSYLQFSWEDFKDDSGIFGYEYRLSFKTGHVTDWIGPVLKDFVSFNTLGLEDGQTYISEVRAINTGQLQSETINSTVLINSQGPQITGQQILTETDGRTITLNWKDVFFEIPDIPVLYDVTIGSAQGFNDILDKAALISDSQTFLVPETTLLTQDVNELFISVSAKHPTGLTTTYETTYRLRG